MTCPKLLSLVYFVFLFSICGSEFIIEYTSYVSSAVTGGSENLVFFPLVNDLFTVEFEINLTLSLQTSIFSTVVSLCH